MDWHLVFCSGNKLGSLSFCGVIGLSQLIDVIVSRFLLM